ncbi:MAG: hypothetical protein SGILL_009730, partial [Bacillariaceae sp.]
MWSLPELKSVNIKNLGLQIQLPNPVTSMEMVAKPSNAGMAVTDFYPKMLEELVLTSSVLEGNIPSEIGYLTSLKHINFVNVPSLTGTLPTEIGNLGELQIVDVSRSSAFTFTIPTEIGLLTNLKIFSMERTGLYGSIPTHIGTMSSLEAFRAKLAVDFVTSIPSEIGLLTKLEEFDLLHNTHTYGTIPTELGLLTNLRILTEAGRNITGTLPAELGNLHKLETMIVVKGQIEGTIPASFGRLQNVDKLVLTGQVLTGTLPNSLSTLRKMTHLVVKENRLTGTIPQVYGMLTNLQVLQVQGNDITGSIGVQILNDDDPIENVILPNDTKSVDVETIQKLEVLFEESATRSPYNWREFFPKPRAPMSAEQQKQQPRIKVPVFVERQIKIARWFITGNAVHSKPSDEKNMKDLNALARMLMLLREYELRYGPSMLAQNVGGYGCQKEVLFNITKDLYSSGTPTWVLETVMSRVAEGMTGRDAEILLLPRRCFFYFPEDGGSGTQKLRRPATTGLFKISPGFYIAKLGEVEKVAVRLASFASNTGSVERINAEWLKMPSRSQLETAKREGYRKYQFDLGENSKSDDREGMAKEILNLASSTYGLFFYANSPDFQEVAKFADSAAPDEEDDFWQVTDSMRVLFSRLAAIEASTSLERIRQEEKQIYSPFMISMFRMLSSAGACGMWFNGGFPDMVASAILAVTV